MCAFLNLHPKPAVGAILSVLPFIRLLCMVHVYAEGGDQSISPPPPEVAG